MATAAATVYVHDDQGSVHEFQPGDTLPSWAAGKITNPAAITDDTPATFPEGSPSEDWKVDDLLAYAEEHGIDLGDAKKKADLLAVIEGSGDSAL
ncbi:hypothetical protein [Rhodococcus marinonascens]|uniref:hypothetical protein n=1 Tax=Rhodococcus marinonascens TaxID=38311 RepID=UPI0009337597|nr:hypothetical protein [Rhodococcus marinonascens]